MLQVGVDDGDAFAKHLQDVFRLEQRTGALPKSRFLSADEDAIELLRSQEREAFAETVDAHHVPRGIAGLRRTATAGPVSLENQNPRSICQRLP